MRNLVDRVRLSVASRLLDRLVWSRAVRPEHLQVLCRRLRVSEIVVEGRFGRMHGKAIDRFIMPSYMRYGIWDKAGVTYLGGRLRDGGTFIDVGANIGMHTVALAQNDRVRILAVEPDPDNFRMLEANVAQNGLSQRVTCIPFAVMDVAGDVEFELAPENMGDHRVRRASNLAALQGEGQRQTISVPAARLDELLAGVQLSAPVVVKMDVQGAELSALRSFGKMLDLVDVLLVEVWPYGLRRLSAEPKQMVDLLTSQFRFAAYTPIGKPLVSQLRPSHEVVSEMNEMLSSEDPRIFGDLILSRAS